MWSVPDSGGRTRVYSGLNGAAPPVWSPSRLYRAALGASQCRSGHLKSSQTVLRIAHRSKMSVVKQQLLPASSLPPYSSAQRSLHLL